MRCVSVTSCPAAAISRPDAPLASFRPAISSVSCCRRGVDVLIRLMTSPNASSAFSLARITEAADWLIFQRSLRRASVGWISWEEDDRPRRSSPLVSASRFDAIASRLSFSSTNAPALPVTAFGAAFARRCVCIRVSPTISVCNVPLAASRLSSAITATTTRNDMPSTISSTCTCVLTGMSPMKGSRNDSSLSTRPIALPRSGRSIITVFGAGLERELWRCSAPPAFFLPNIALMSSAISSSAARSTRRRGYGPAQSGHRGPPR